MPTTGTVTVGQITFGQGTVQGQATFTAAPTGPIPSPLANPAAWDTVYVQGVPWQGKIEFRNPRLVQNWDAKTGRGVEGSTDSYVGIKPEGFEIVFYLWTDGHFTRWQTFSQLFKYAGAKGSATPSSIYHPCLAMVGITAVTCLELGAVLPAGDELLWSASVKLRQFRPPVPMPKVLTPGGAASASDPNLPGSAPKPAAFYLAEARLDDRQRTVSAMPTLGALP